MAIGSPSGENKQRPRPERRQTDASLRVEREKVDEAIDLTFSTLEQLADTVIEKARGRADAVLARARAREDRTAVRADARSAGMLARNRLREDEVLRQERAEADELVRAERASQRSSLSESHDVHLSQLRHDTDEDLLEERLRADDALAARDDFLGIVSHDLRNLLGSVMGFATLIERTDLKKSHAEDVVRLNAQRIQRSVTRMGRLIGDLVDVVSIEADTLALNREVGDPAALVLEVVESFQTQAAAAEVKLFAELNSPLPRVPFDSVRIIQVLANLLSNAIKFTPPKGQVVIHAERADDELRFGVRDTGPGIAVEELEAIFERFHQVDPHDRRGVGLGLYIAKCIVHGHHGRIWAETKLGEGSTFYFTLPMSAN